MSPISSEFNMQRTIILNESFMKVTTEITTGSIIASTIIHKRMYDLIE